MASRQEALKPQDVAVAVHLGLSPGSAYSRIAADLLISASTAHESVERLQLAGLLRPESRQVNRHSLLEFLEHGLRYVFPVRPERKVRGVPTAYSASPLAQEILSEDVVVWAHSHGSATGHSITPLLERAAELVIGNPQVYALLTLIDAIRIGRARERTRAIELIRERLAVVA